jgi:hypothetical protein
VHLLRTLVGEERGANEIRRLLSGIELNGADVIFTLTAPFTWLMNLLDKFITPTAFSYSCNLFLLCFIITLAFGHRLHSPVRTAAGLVLATAGAFLFHVVTGTVLILTMIGAGILALIVPRILKSIPLGRFHVIAVPASAIIAALLTFPYFLSLTSGGGGGGLSSYLHFGITNLLTLAAPLFVLLPFSLRAARDIFGTNDEPHRLLSFWISAIVVIALFADLPGISENKVLFPLFLLLVPFIARRIVDALAGAHGLRRLLLAAWITLLFLVPPVLTVRGFILERPRTPHFAKRYALSADECEIYGWIRNETAVDAVIAERNTYNLPPVYAKRRSFMLNPLYTRVHNYGGEKVDRYAAIHRELFSGSGVSAETVAELRAAGYPLYIVVWEEDREAVPGIDAPFTAHPDWFEKVYENPAGTVYKLI